MLKTSRKSVTVALALLVVALVAGCAAPAPAPQPSKPAAPAPSPKPSPAPAPTPAPAPAPAPKSYTIKIGASALGTSGYNFAITLQKMALKYTPEIKLTVIPTSGYSENAALLRDGKVEMASAYLYLTGKEEPWWKDWSLFTPSGDIYHLAIVKADSPIRTWEDLRGKTLLPGPKGGAGTVWYEQLLTDWGWKVDKDFKFIYVTYIEQGAYLREGKADAITCIWDPRGAYAVDCFTGAKCRFVEISPEKYEATLKRYPAGTIVRTVLPGGVAAGIDTPYNTWVNMAVHFAKKDVPDDVMYRLTWAIWGHRDEAIEHFGPIRDIQPSYFQRKVAHAYHPGALKYFKEIGWIK